MYEQLILERMLYESYIKMYFLGERLKIMKMNKELTKVEGYSYADDIFDLDDYESELESKLDVEFEELKFLNDEKDKIGSPDCLGETIKGVIWEQFCNQIGVSAGNEFIEENHGLTLDLRDEAHIQTAENFANGKIATHNYISKEQSDNNQDKFS